MSSSSDSGKDTDRLRLAVEATGLGAWEFDCVTRRLRWSQRCLPLLGLDSSRPVRAADFWRVVHPDDRRKLRDAAAAAFACHGKATLRCAFRVLAVPDGGERWLEASASAGPAGLTGILLDVTDAQQARRFRALIEKGWDAVVLLRSDRVMTYISDAVHRILGYRPEECVGLRADDFLHPSDILRFKTQFRALRLALGASVKSRYRCRHKDGHYVWVEGRGTNLLLDPDVRAIVANYRDITHTVVAERRQLESEQRLALTQKAACVAGWERNVETNAVMWFGAIVEVFGKTPRSYDDWLVGLHPDDRELFERTIDEAVRQGSDFDCEYRYRRADGSVRWLMCKGRAFYDDADRPTRVLGLHLDITDRKTYEASLEAEKTAAEEASQAKSAFLASMSHELRNPLTAILGYAEVLRETGLAAEETQRYAEVIARNGRDLGRLLDDILDLSKVEAGRLDLERLPVHLPELLAEVEQVVAVKAQEKSVAVTFEGAADVPTTIMTDPTRLRQVLLNIIGNAVKFTECGAVQVRVRLAGGNRRRLAVAFVVRDTGKGIAPEHATELFQPFAQGDESTTRRFGGTGLGLMLSRRLARLMGGDVVLESSVPGEGSTFVITVDAGTPAELATQPAGAAAPAPSGPLLVGARVLVVDDSEDNRTFIAKMLEGPGNQVEFAENGAEAIAKSLAHPFDVVLMDLQMPVLDGYAATEELRRRGYRRSIVALTAHAMREERERSLASGCDAHLAKPIGRDQLIETVARFKASDRGSSSPPGPRA